MWRLLTSHSFHPWYVPWEKPAQSTWGRRWWKAIPWKNRLSPPEDAVDERLSHGKTGSVHLRTPLMKGYPMEKPAQSTWGRRWWKAIPWKNPLSPPEDAVDERLSHGKTRSVHLRTPLMKGYPMEKPAQSTWGRRWWKAIPWKNRLSPPEDAVDERLSHGKTRSVHLRTPLMKGYPMEKPAQSTWGRRWWKAIPWKNRLSPPEDAVDERLSHGKTRSVHLRTPLMKGYPMEKPAQSTWGRRWWKAIPWKNPLSPPEDAVDERLSHGKTRSVHLRTPLMKGYPMEKPAQSTWGRRWWKAIPWKNRLSPPEDAVDERLSHGKTRSVHLRTPLMKGYPMEKPAQSTWGRRWWKAIPWKNPLSPPEDAVDERLSHGKTRSVHLRTPLMKGYPMEKPAQSTWGRRWWKAIPWKNRLSPPEDAVDERLSHGKTRSVHLRTPLMKGYPMEKTEMSWPYFGRTGDVHNFANVTSPVLPLNPSIIKCVK